MELIFMNIINQKEAAGVIAGPGSSQQPNCVVTKPFFILKDALYVLWKNSI